MLVVRNAVVGPFGLARRIRRLARRRFDLGGLLDDDLLDRLDLLGLRKHRNRLRGRGRPERHDLHLGARATGIEYDRALHRIAIEARHRLSGLVDPDRAVLRRGDFFRADYAEYDVLYYYKSGAYAETRLGLKIAAELRPDAVLLVLAGEPEHFPDLEPVAAYGPVRAFRRGAP